MRVEQRIGRIDRIGQQRPVISVRNYVIPNTVEEDVDAALADRIDIFRGLLGTLQPILGATEAAFRTIFRAPRSERRAIEAQTINALVGRVEELQRSGIDFSAEDPLPIPERPPSPVTLSQLQEALVELDITLDEPGRPVTVDPSRTSRDPENWAALATYGHPRLEPLLSRLATEVPANPLSVATDGDRGPVAIYRADRSPAARVTGLPDLDDLGPAVAVGEAEERARRALDEAIRERAQRRRDVLRRRRTHWQQSVQDRFRRLVQQVVTAECVAARKGDQDGLDPVVVWMDLIREPTTAWRYAEAFRQHLGLTVPDVLPTLLSEGGPVMTSDQLRRQRAETGQALNDLMVEWRQRQATST